MTQQVSDQRSKEQLVEELTYVKAKLNDQKVLIAQLQTAVSFWRHEASPKPMAAYHKTWSAPFNPKDPKSRESAVRMARTQLLAGWASELKGGGMWAIRLIEEDVPANDVTSWTEFRITMHVWEKPDHGTTNHNT